MSRYIDADELTKRIKVSPIFMADEENADEDFLRKFLKDEVLVLINEQLTADVVEVTRCKDCKFYRPYNKPAEDFDGRCFARECETDGYDFCSYSVRRKEEEKG